MEDQKGKKPQQLPLSNKFQNLGSSIPLKPSTLIINPSPIKLLGSSIPSRPCTITINPSTIKTDKSSTPSTMYAQAITKPNSQNSEIIPSRTIYYHTSSSHNKPQTSFITILEPEYLENFILETIQKTFSSNFHFIPNHPRKIRLFYEYIRVETDSIKITHTRNKEDPTKIAFSKIKILGVLTPTKWNQSIYTDFFF